MLTLCYSIMSYVTPILMLSCVHVSNAYLLDIMRTLVATCMILGGLECTRSVYVKNISHQLSITDEILYLKVKFKKEKKKSIWYNNRRIVHLKLLLH